MSFGRWFVLVPHAIYILTCVRFGMNTGFWLTGLLEGSSHPFKHKGHRPDRPLWSSIWSHVIMKDCVDYVQSLWKISWVAFINHVGEGVLLAIWRPLFCKKSKPAHGVVEWKGQLVLGTCHAWFLATVVPSDQMAMIGARGFAGSWGTIHWVQLIRGTTAVWKLLRYCRNPLEWMWQIGQFNKLISQGIQGIEMDNQLAVRQKIQRDLYLPLLRLLNLAWLISRCGNWSWPSSPQDCGLLLLFSSYTLGMNIRCGFWNVYV